MNESSDAVTVSINGTWSSDIDAGATTIINQMLTQPQPPTFPWAVTINDSNGDLLFTATMDTPVDQKVTLTNDGSLQVPYSLTDEGC